MLRKIYLKYHYYKINKDLGYLRIFIPLFFIKFYPKLKNLILKKNIF